MDQKTDESDRLNRQLPLYAVLLALVVFVTLAITPFDLSLILRIFVVFPFLFITTVSLLIYAAIGKNRRHRLPILLALTFFWAISTPLHAYDFRHPSAIRTAARWLLLSHDYKVKVLAQPDSANGDMKHIEWDGWGMFAQDTTVFLVFDPSDALLAASKSHQPGKFGGIPCEVLLVSRLESHWYTVVFYTGQAWGQCS